MLPLARQIDALLPQTQCARCGYDGCLPYAEALAAGTADINRCPPGGDGTIAALAQLLEQPAKPLDPACGAAPEAAVVAVVDEPLCIGCFKCIQACPVDAIVGAPGQMHTVIAAECSGCALCIPPCPVDCISLAARPADLPPPAVQAELWRRRHRARKERMSRQRQDQADKRRRRAGSLQEQARQFDIAGAITRARSRRDAAEPKQ